MFKLVLCAIFAVAVAKPGVLLSSQLTPLTSIVSPGVTTYTNQASSVVHPSPIIYSAPWSYSHYIKKRSPQFPITYVAPNTYLTTNPLAATAYGAPFYHTQNALPIATTHLIKKRSAPLLSTAYISPTTYTAATPLVASTYTATSPLISSPYFTTSPLISQPLTYSTHFIKKRSAPVISTYITPTSFSRQSRIDLNSAPWVSSYNSPLIYSAPNVAFSHII